MIRNGMTSYEKPWKHVKILFFSCGKFVAQMQYNVWALLKFAWKHRRSDFVFVFWTENIWTLNSHTVCKQWCRHAVCVQKGIPTHSVCKQGCRHTVSQTAAPQDATPLPRAIKPLCVRTVVAVFFLLLLLPLLPRASPSAPREPKSSARTGINSVAGRNAVHLQPREGTQAGPQSPKRAPKWAPIL